ncbi:MAG: molybdopterin-dependent oxidoreductase [Nitrospirae bacterium]|nr:molybdopterin-dependent oxidoreductase [Nitrospirota bacterium]
MANLTRRDLMKIGMASGALLAAGEGFKSPALAGTVKIGPGGKDFSPQTGVERQAIPSSCWQCVTRCPNMGYMEDGRLVKIESNPNSIRTEGKMCARGQGGVSHSSDPDRILYPMKRAGKRGEGKWKRISWDEALTELADRMKKLRDAGTPEKFMFHYGRMKASSEKLMKDAFLATYGSKTGAGHTAICEGGKWVGQELTWGKHYDNWDFDNTNYVLNFGSNVLEAHTNHIPTSHRLIRAKVDKGVKMVTFDVRLSNTAAKSDEWVPLKPGTDGAVMLAMCNVIMSEGLYDRDFLKFVKATKNKDAPDDEKIASLKAHLAQYTPQWAEKISGVSASKIKTLAIEFARAKPACLLTYRGAVAHYNGVENERIAMMLASITGNIDNPGGRCKAVAASWKFPTGPKDKPEAKKLKIDDGFKGQVAYPTHHVDHQVFKMIKDGKEGRPEIYMWYCYAPVYANGEIQETIDILKDESLIPFTVCSNPFYDEAAALADMILPDTPYTERWDWDGDVSPMQIAEYQIRQPFVKPLGESRNLMDVACELANRMGFPLGFNSMEEFVTMSGELTPEVKALGGIEYLKKNGVWHDPNAKPKFYSYKKEVKEEELKAEGVIYDDASGVYWNWKKSKAKDEAEAQQKGYAHTKDAYKGYVGQKIGDKVYTGFKPDILNKSGYMELYSELMEEKKFNPLPSYLPIPEHEKMGAGDLILTTYKAAVITQSRSANCKWLSELYHDNPAWINPKTAAGLGIKTGDKIKVKSVIDEITTKARVTEGVIPGVIAISHSVGHWEYGRYASGKKGPDASGAHDNDPDLKTIWWEDRGVHPNWIIPNSPDPIGGQQRWMDTVVKVTKA